MIKYHSQTPEGFKSTGGGWGSMGPENQWETRRGIQPTCSVTQNKWFSQKNSARAYIFNDGHCESQRNGSSLPFPAQWDRKGPARAAPASPRRPSRTRIGPPRHCYCIVPEDASGKEMEKMDFKHRPKGGLHIHSVKLWKHSLWLASTPLVSFIYNT